MNQVHRRAHETTISRSCRQDCHMTQKAAQSIQVTQRQGVAPLGVTSTTRLDNRRVPGILSADLVLKHATSSISNPEVCGKGWSMAQRGTAGSTTNWPSNQDVAQLVIEAQLAKARITAFPDDVEAIKDAQETMQRLFLKILPVLRHLSKGWR